MMRGVSPSRRHRQSSEGGSMADEGDNKLGMVNPAELEHAEEKKSEEDGQSSAALESNRTRESIPRETLPSTTTTTQLVRHYIVRAFNRKASPTQLGPWIALSLTLDGRDKITKLLQYVSRLMAWWLRSPRFAALKASLSQSRKAFYLGRSVIEFQKLHSMGVWKRIQWHLQNNLPENEGDETEEGSAGDRPSFWRRASSNIALSPAMISERNYHRQSSAWSRVYRPLLSQLSLLVGADSNGPCVPDMPDWKLVGSLLKISGLFVFWTADNVNFLASTGVLDNYQLTPTQRLAQRNKLKSSSSRIANQSYFFGALAGLAVSLRTYWEWRQQKIRFLQEQLEQTEDDERRQQLESQLSQAQDKQIVLFLALLKSSCDTLVFSNNEGINLWKASIGSKMHEGFHCLCGIVSACTVLYSNFPNSIKQ